MPTLIHQLMAQINDGKLIDTRNVPEIVKKYLEKCRAK